MTAEQVIAIRGIRANFRPRAVRVVNKPNIPMCIAHTPDGPFLVHKDGHLTKIEREGR
jgi:hypothetical protein